MKSTTRIAVAATQGTPPSGWFHTLGIFGCAGLLLFVSTHVPIPLFSESTGREPVLLWFLIGGLGVFAPLVVGGCLFLRRERHPAGQRCWVNRLRFRRMSRSDWTWGIGATIVIGILGAGIQTVLAALGGGDLHPPFMAFEPLSPGRYWLLAAWLPFWLLNIVGEEFLWRGVVLPRQEVALGSKAWIANACGWMLFHVAFGWQLVCVLLPILIIVPYVVQRRRNTWVGVVIHAGVNGPGFVAVAFGLV